MSALDDNPLVGNEKYRLVRRLGAGSMGEVYLGHHVSLDKPVVIKVILAELATSATKVDRMRLEAQSLARLDHPNIVRVTDFDQTADGRPFIVMDFLQGRTVAEEMQVRGGFLPVVEALEIVRQAAAGLAGAHHAGLVHRDLKLENLFLCDPHSSSDSAKAPRTVKVIDFGLAKTLDGERRRVSPLVTPTQAGIVVGTPAFLAPEQAAGGPVDHRADIYALGLVLYTLLALRGPFDDTETIAALVEAQISQVPAPPSRYASQAIPPELDALVLKCLAKSPEDRPQSATELSAKISSIITRLGVAGDRTAPRSQPRAIAALAALDEASTLRSNGKRQRTLQYGQAADEDGDGSAPAKLSAGALASTLPMDAPNVAELGLDSVAEANPSPQVEANASPQLTAPMPAVQPSVDVLGSTHPVDAPQAIQMDPVPMGELLRPAAAPMQAVADAPADAAASGLMAASSGSLHSSQGGADAAAAVGEAPPAGTWGSIADPPTGASGPPPAAGGSIADPPTGASGPPPATGGSIADPAPGVSGPPPGMAGPITDPPAGAAGAPQASYVQQPYLPLSSLGTDEVTEVHSRPGWVTALFAVIVLGIVATVVTLIVLFAR